jgi:hypothetical protein
MFGEKRRRGWLDVERKQEAQKDEQGGKQAEEQMGRASTGEEAPKTCQENSSWLATRITHT